MTSIESAWQTYQQQILSFIRSRVNSDEDAEDILSEVFAKLIAQEHTKELPDNVLSWLYRVTRNRIVDYYRARKQFEQLPADLAQEKPQKDVLTQLASCLLPMIQSLSEDYQRVLIRSEIAGKKQKEIAKELGLSLPAVKSRILRGREMLKQSMVRCCAVYQNSSGRIVDYEQKPSSLCGDCETE